MRQLDYTVTEVCPDPFELRTTIAFGTPRPTFDFEATRRISYRSKQEEKLRALAVRTSMRERAPDPTCNLDVGLEDLLCESIDEDDGIPIDVDLSGLEEDVGMSWKQWALLSLVCVAVGVGVGLQLSRGEALPQLVALFR